MTLREAFEKATAEAWIDADPYRRTFEIMHGRMPSDDERDMIKRRCLWYECAGPAETSAGPKMRYAMG